MLNEYFDAGYPVVAVETVEEKRLLQQLKTEKMVNSLLTIAAAGGLKDEIKQSTLDPSMQFTKAFDHLGKLSETIMVVFDFQHMISAPTSYRPLLANLDKYKANGDMVILVAPHWRLSAELKHTIPVLKIDLPTAEELKIPLQVVLESSGKRITSSVHDELTSSARGLTLEQAENVFALCSSKKYNFSREIVEREKMRLVRSDYMSVESPRDVSSLAGLGQLKNYVTNEILPSREDIQLQVRGILLVGVPGTGKSLSARVMSSLLHWPLIRFDVSAAKGSLVGQSESNVRQALATADAVAPCVLWLDEIEKAVGGHSSSAATDGGTTLAMVGTLLTWMQEHTSQVLVVATCNDYAKLPSELTRAGRFDERFFLDIPSRKEREEIALVHLKNLKCDENWADSIAEMTVDWTGAEIESLIKSAARQTKRQLSLEMLDACKREVIPISRSKDITALREWASKNLRRANDADVVTEGPVRRKAIGSRQ